MERCSRADHGDLPLIGALRRPATMSAFDPKQTLS
jgi:hypothetical protein